MLKLNYRTTKPTSKSTVYRSQSQRDRQDNITRTCTQAYLRKQDVHIQEERSQSAFIIQRLTFSSHILYKKFRMYLDKSIAKYMRIY